VAANTTLTPANVTVLAGPIVLGGNGTGNIACHTHPTSDIIGLDGKLSVLTSADAAINANLAGKANRTHNHAASEITGLDIYIPKPPGATVNQILAYNGTVWNAVNAPTGGGGGSNYTLPVATTATLGGVKQGANTTIGVDGTLSVVLPAAANLTGYIQKPPTATANQILTYNGTLWTAANAPTGGAAMPTGTVAGELLTFDGTVWAGTGGFLTADASQTHYTNRSGLGYTSDDSGLQRVGLLDPGRYVDATFLTLGDGNTRYLPTPTTPATANQVLTYDGAAWVAADTVSKYVLPVANLTVLGGVKQGANVTIDPTGLLSVNLPAAGLTQATANTLYQPKLSNATYTKVTVPALSSGVTAFSGDSYLDVSGALGSGGKNTTYLRGVMHHGSLPDIPYGTVVGEYQADPTNGTLGAYALLKTDYREIGIYCKGDGVSRLSYVSARKDTVYLAAGTDGDSSSINLGAITGALYTPPTTLTTLTNPLSMLNMGQMDTRYLSKPASATANQVLTYNGTAWNAANASAAGLTKAQADLLYQPLSGGMQTLTDAANVTWPLDPAKLASLTLGGTRTLSNPTNKAAGSVYLLLVKQNTTGGFALNFGTEYKFPAGIKPIIPITANSVTILTFVSDGVNMYGLQQGDFR